MRLLDERPHIPFGIHLALIRDSLDYRWGPVAARRDVPSLLDPSTDELYVDAPAQRSALLAAAKLTEVERELRAQIEAVVEVGLAPTHLDWHCLADGGRADILDLTMTLASGSTRAAARLVSRESELSTTPSWTASASALTTRRRRMRECSATYRRVSTNGPSIQRAAPSNGSRSSRPGGMSGRATTRSSPHKKHVRSWIVKATPSSTTGHCKRPGTPSRVPIERRRTFRNRVAADGAVRRRTSDPPFV